MDEDEARAQLEWLRSCYESMPTDDEAVRSWLTVLRHHEKADVHAAMELWMKRHPVEWPMPAQIATVIERQKERAPRMREVARQAYEAERARQGKPATSDIFKDAGSAS